MKKNLMPLLTALLFASPFISFAQTDPSETEAQAITNEKADWVSEKGYWVAEGNLNNPKSHTIYFYNNDQVLVYQERLDGVKLNFKKRKTMLQMKAALEASIAAWDTTKTVATNQYIVAESLGIVSR